MELVAKDLAKTFPGGRKAALAGVSLVLGRGLYLLEGPNGSGKTTLLKTLSGALEFDSGTVLAGGTPADPERLRELAAWCPQSPRAFYYRLTALENLRFFGALAGLAASEAEGRARELAEQLNLSAADLEVRFDSLSEGNMQKVSLIRTFSRRAPFTFLDEPLRGLDATAKKGLSGLLEDCAAAGCVLAAGHERPELKARPAGIIRLEAGRAAGA